MHFNKLRDFFVIVNVVICLYVLIPIFSNCTLAASEVFASKEFPLCKETDTLKPITFKLWEGGPPGMVINAGEEKPYEVYPYSKYTVANVSIPAMAVYLPAPDKANGIAVIYCSGGSYTKVSYISDHVMDADYFVQKGVAVMILKYRTSPPCKDSSDAIADAKRALRIVRHRAQEWNIDPNKIGMLGGSAGANLILNLATHWDSGNAQSIDPIEQESCKPDFISLLSPWPNKQPISDFPVTKDTPPVFLCSASDDTIAPVTFAQGIATSYEHALVPSKTWVIKTGGHRAFRKGGAGGNWIKEFWSWLKDIKILDN